LHQATRYDHHQVHWLVCRRELGAGWSAKQCLL
jgi:hypothetical protein